MVVGWFDENDSEVKSDMCVLGWRELRISCDKAARQIENGSFHNILTLENA